MRLCLPSSISREASFISGFQLLREEKIHRIETPSEEFPMVRCVWFSCVRGREGHREADGAGGVSILRGPDAMDVESQWRFCFFPLFFRTKRRYYCNFCTRRLVLKE
ncbi:hypothetical protein SAY87_000920 [Trapa incisa]|uniref:Uncharacterized protein n=1 Tax=Trapa incisa TaxID=236973 RepID=A0AAN7GSB6_9MYRT|nr:hypothetical protein SAY87_000920 [Trapa incisa]